MTPRLGQSGCQLVRKFPTYLQEKYVSRVPTELISSEVEFRTNYFRGYC